MFIKLKADSLKYTFIEMPHATSRKASMLHVEYQHEPFFLVGF